MRQYLILQSTMTGAAVQAWYRVGSVQRIDAAETIFTDTAEFKAGLNQSSDAPF